MQFRETLLNDFLALPYKVWGNNCLYMFLLKLFPLIFIMIFGIIFALLIDFIVAVFTIADDV